VATLTFEPLSQLGPRSVRWLWGPVLPRGKLAVLDGDPNVGKSLVTIDLAARLSRGGPLPDGTPIDRPHVTLLLSAEDGSADTVRPRAEAAGADLDRLIVARAADGRVVRLPADLAELEELVRLCEADLVVIDPVMAFLPPEVAATSDQCVRQALTPLTELAERTDCAVLLVRHLRKSSEAKAIYRGLGSVGIVGACRTGLLAARHPADPELRVLAVTKSNLARPPAALGFRVRSDGSGRGVVEWTGPADLTADGLLRRPEAGLRPRDRATDWLRGELANGPRKAAELLTAAAAAGIPEKTLKRAKADLRAGSHQVHRGDERAWYWYDPCAPWPADAPFQKPFELPPLPDLSDLLPYGRR
jgi:hypothetical protein